MINPTNKLPWYLEESDLNIDTYSLQVENDHVVICDISCVLEGDKEDAKYLVLSCNNFPKSIKLLNQIVEDLNTLQNHPDDLAHDQLMLFYDRMCANVTDIEEFLKKIENE